MEEEFKDGIEEYQEDSFKKEDIKKDYNPFVRKTRHRRGTQIFWFVLLTIGILITYVSGILVAYSVGSTNSIANTFSEVKFEQTSAFRKLVYLKLDELSWYTENFMTKNEFGYTIDEVLADYRENGVDIAQEYGAISNPKNENTTYEYEDLIDWASGIVTEQDLWIGNDGDYESSEEFDKSISFYERYLPKSGKSIKKYAKQNDIPLHVLLQQLKTTVEMMSEDDFQAQRRNSIVKNLEVPSNMNFYLQIGEYEPITNISTWNSSLADEGKEQENAYYYNSISDEYYNNFYRIAANSWLYIGEEPLVFYIKVDTNYQIMDEFHDAAKEFAIIKPWLGIAPYGLIFGLLICIVCFIFLTIQTGRIPREGEDESGVHLNGFDRIPTELAAVMCLFGLYFALQIIYEFIGSVSRNSIYSVIGFGIFIVVGALVIMGSYLSLIRRIKANILWKNSLTCSIVRLCKAAIGATKLTIRAVIAYLVFLLGNLIFVLSGGFGILIAFFIDMVILLCIMRNIAGKQTVIDGVKRISAGNLQYKIPVESLKGENYELAVAINNIGDGLKRAVDSSLKNEHMKTELITNVSHDIKTPLTSIINYVDLLKRENIPEPKIKGYIQVLDEKSQRLKHLTEDLVEASKVSSGNIDLAYETINFNQLIYQTQGEFDEKFAARGLQLLMTLPDKDLFIQADGRRLWRIIENLYNNVAKYAMPGTRVYLELKESDGQAKFSLKNISEYQLNFKAEELTERFIRGDVSRSTEGSGLGLSIAQNLTELQNGQFHIYLDGDLFKVTVSFPLI